MNDDIHERMAAMVKDFEDLADRLYGKERPPWFYEDYYTATEIQVAATKYAAEQRALFINLCSNDAPIH